MTRTIVAWTIVAWTIDGGVGCNLPTHLSVFAVEISDFELIDGSDRSQVC